MTTTPAWRRAWKVPDAE
jgi:hypothetical protein